MGLMSCLEFKLFECEIDENQARRTFNLLSGKHDSLVIEKVDVDQSGEFKLSKDLNSSNPIQKDYKSSKLEFVTKSRNTGSDGENKSSVYITRIDSSNLNFKYRSLIDTTVHIDNLAAFLEQFIASFFGFKISILKGLAVKNSQGIKIKPEIKIFCKATLIVSIPDVLEFTKGSFTCEEKYQITSTTFVSDSDVINSLISSVATLFFKGDGTVYCLKNLNGSNLIVQCEQKKSLISDIVFKKSSIQKYIEILGTKNTEINKSILNVMFRTQSDSGVDKKEALPDYKNVKYTDYPCLFAAVENAPRFFDWRDRTVGFISDILEDRAPLIKMKNCDTLDIKKKRVVCKYNPLSLKKILTKPHEKRI